MIKNIIAFNKTGKISIRLTKFHWCEYFVRLQILITLQTIHK